MICYIGEVNQSESTMRIGCWISRVWLHITHTLTRVVATPGAFFLVILKRRHLCFIVFKVLFVALTERVFVTLFVAMLLQVPNIELLFVIVDKSLFHRFFHFRILFDHL